jgi:pilus assembly protein CpaC
MKRAVSLYLAAALWLLAGILAPVHASSDTVVLYTGEGKLIELANDVDRLFVADPSVADLEAISGNQAYVFGVEVGETVITAVDQENQWVATLKVMVRRSPEQARRAINQMQLGNDVDVVYLGERPVISGKVDTPKEARRVDELRKQLDGDNTALDLTEYTGATQVLLELRIAEIQTIGLRRTGIRFDPENDFGLLDALASRGLVQILAEPSLMTTNGTTARFVSGGEFAVESGTEQSGISFKSYGVSLEFTPTILDRQRVSLNLNSEISAPSAGAVAGQNAGQVPGRTVRSVSNTVELKSGETYVVAGLFQQNSDRMNSNVPGISQVPVIGNLFRAQRFETQENELIVLVTPTIVPRNFTPSKTKSKTTAQPKVSDTVGFTLRPGMLK